MHGLRLNPGNLRKPEEIKLVAREARDRGVPIRIGVNAGSLHPEIYERFGGATPEALVESARLELAYFEEVDFRDVKISVKASSVATMIAAYRLASATFDHPLHLGVTEAGPLPGGLVKGTAGIGTLLAEGIGDTLRYSLTADPVEEARAGRTLLEVLGLRERKGLDLIACPRLRARRGRRDQDRERGAEALWLDVPMQVAVMGCVVNGPGRGAPRGPRDRGGEASRPSLHPRSDHSRRARRRDGRRVGGRGEEDHRRGCRGATVARDVSAESEAAADRAALLDDKGTDVNHTQERIDKIRRHVEN